MSTELELLITARNQAQSAFDQLGKQIDKLKGGGEDVQKSFRGAAKETEGFGGKVKEVAGDILRSVGPFGQLTAAVALGTGAVGAFAEVGKKAIEFAAESVATYRDEESIVLQLTAAIQLHGGAVEKLLPKYDALADRTSEQTLFSKDDTLRAITFFNTVGDLGPQQTELAVAAATKLATVMRVDLATASEYVNRYLEGNVTALNRAGIQLDGTIPITQGATAALVALNDKFGDVPAAAAKGSAGAQHAWDEALSKLKGNFGSVLHVLEDGAQRAGARILSGLDPSKLYPKADGGGKTLLEGEGQKPKIDLGGLLPAGLTGLPISESAEDVKKGEDAIKVASQQVSTALTDQARAAAIVVSQLGGLASSGRPAAEVMARGGAAAKQFFDQLQALSDRGIPINEKALQGLIDRARAVATSINAAGAAAVLHGQMETETATIIDASSKKGLDAKVAAVRGEEKLQAMALDSQMAQLQLSEAQKGKLRLDLAKNYDAKVRALTIADQTELQVTLLNMAAKSSAALIAARPAGAQTDTDALRSALVTQVLITNLTRGARDAAILNQQAVNDFRAQSDAIRIREERATNDEVIRLGNDALAAQVGAEARGLDGRLASLRIATDAEVAAVQRSGLLAENKAAKITAIERNASAQRAALLVSNARDVGDQIYAIDVQIAQEKIAASMSGVQAALAATALERDEKERSVRLEIEADRRILASRAALYAAEIMMGDYAAARRTAADMAALEQILADDQAYLDKLEALFNVKFANLRSVKKGLLDLNEEVGRFGSAVSDAGDLFKSKILQHIGDAATKIHRMVTDVHDIFTSINKASGILSSLAGGSGQGILSKIPGLGGIFGGGAAAAGGGAAGSAAGGGGAAAGGGGGGLGLLGPIALIAGAGLGLVALGKHLWGDAGTDAKQDFGNKNYWPGFGKGLDNMHKLLIAKLGPRMAEDLWQESGRIGKKDKTAARIWEKHIVDALGTVGLGGFQVFGDGGVVDEPTLAVVGDKGREWMIPDAQMQALVAGGGGTHHHYHMNAAIHAWDAPSLLQFMKGAGGRGLVDAWKTSGSFRQASRDALGIKD